MTKIVIAPDKFKGSLTGMQFCNAVEEGIKSRIEDAEILKLPLADGGDGTMDALEHYTGGRQVCITVHDPLMRKTLASYLFAEEKKMAFIEMAEASGIRLLKKEDLNPLLTTTYGTGEMIADALKKGAKQIVLGIGGSATNDAGMGMARALGYCFFDVQGKELLGAGADLDKLNSIDSSMVNPLMKEVNFEVACDVDNPLYGKQGAAYVYGPQKGADTKTVEKLDKGLQNFNRVANNVFSKNLQGIEGAGAAGGLGAGSVLFLNARLISGISFIKEIADFDNKIKNSNWIITGEGRLDEQSFSGKVIKGVIDSRTNQKLAVFCGLSELDQLQHKKYGINYLAETLPLAKNFEDSIRNSYKYINRLAEEFATKWLT